MIVPVVVYGNNKGGVGKTTVVAAQAAALARRGRRVLVVDMDPQANLTRRLGYPEVDVLELPTVSEAIKAGADGVAADAVTACRWDDPTANRIRLLPARYDLENRISEAGQVGAVYRLRRALAGVVDAYDWTLIDCPPSLGHLTQLALATGDLAVTVVVPEYDGVAGAVRWRDFITRYAGDLGVPTLRLAGVIVNDVDRRLGLHGFHLEGLVDDFATLVWQPPVPDRSALAEANDAATPVHAIGGPVGRELTDVFDALTDELEKTQ